MKVLLGVTGSVAAKLTQKLVDRLILKGHEVQVVATEPAFYFFDPSALELTARVRGAKNFRLWRERDEWPKEGYVKDMPVVHIELRKWADVLLVAPLTANTLGKMANGLVDNLLTSVVRAWDLKNKPVIVAPAMNTLMWEHPATREHLEKLRAWYSHFSIVMPVAANLACGDVGVGAMADLGDIVEEVNFRGK